MYSSLGPKGSLGDMDNDGYEDLFIGGSKGFAPVILKGGPNKFTEQNQAVFDKNKG